jgi:hypothetical protein
MILIPVLQLSSLGHRMEIVSCKKPVCSSLIVLRFASGASKMLQVLHWETGMVVTTIDLIDFGNPKGLVTANISESFGCFWVDSFNNLRFFVVPTLSNFQIMEKVTLFGTLILAFSSEKMQISTKNIKEQQKLVTILDIAIDPETLTSIRCDMNECWIVVVIRNICRVFSRSTGQCTSFILQHSVTRVSLIDHFLATKEIGDSVVRIVNLQKRQQHAKVVGSSSPFAMYSVKDGKKQTEIALFEKNFLNVYKMGKLAFELNNIRRKTYGNNEN